MDVKDYMVIGSIYVMFKNKQNYDGSDNDRHGALCGFWWFYVLFLDLNLGVNYTGLFTWILIE